MEMESKLLFEEHELRELSDSYDSIIRELRREIDGDNPNARIATSDSAMPTMSGSVANYLDTPPVIVKLMEHYGIKYDYRPIEDSMYVKIVNFRVMDLHKLAFRISVNKDLIMKELINGIAKSHSLTPDTIGRMLYRVQTSYGYNLGIVDRTIQQIQHELNPRTFDDILSQRLAQEKINRMSNSTIDFKF